MNQLKPFIIALSVSLVSLSVIGCTEKTEEKPMIKDYPLIKKLSIQTAEDYYVFLDFNYQNDQLSSINWSYDVFDEQIPITYRYEGNRIYVSREAIDRLSDTLIINNNLCTREKICERSIYKRSELTIKDFEYWDSWNVSYSFIGDSLVQVGDEESTVLDYQYSRNKELIGVSGNKSSASFFWDNGNINEAIFEDFYDELNGKFVFSYYEDSNPFYGQPIDPFMAILQLPNYDLIYGGCLTTILNKYGPRSKNLIKAVNINCTELSGKVSFRYSYNSDNLLTGVQLVIGTPFIPVLFRNILSCTIEYYD